ncbi:MAG TPA: Na(+)/H(+) antiporter subunit D [Gammaproteobacteria bacterium]|nr:Na(+)/H(+) antiporter subunit D [Gammaproteobacteria bacterium]
MTADMPGWLLHTPPGVILAVGVLLVPFLRGRVRGAYMLLLPVLGALHLALLPHGTAGHPVLFGQTLTLVRVDALSQVFGYVFYFAAFAGVLFSLKVRDPMQQVASLVYAGTAIGAVFAGDLITLFAFWELTAVASVFLVWASRSTRAYAAGLRYLLVQITSGVLLLSGGAVRFVQTGSIGFDHMTLAGLGSILLFLAFGIKAAFPLLHNWLTDAYPEATPGGSVFLSVFTTKMAIYALARGFAGTEILIWIGVATVIFTLIYAAVENDLRRVLGYCLINQLGFMVIGIGIGTQLGIDGAAAHAVSHVLYKSLLFMCMGAVMTRTGTARATELGGLYRSMPWTTTFCILASLGMSAPLFAGYTSKALLLKAAADTHHEWVWLVLVFGAAGIFLLAGVKVVWYAFFNRDAGLEVAEAPRNMLLAMAITAGALLAIGVHPAIVWNLLPYPVHDNPYTPGHVLGTLQLLALTVAGFALLLRTGLWPRPGRRILLDSDWIYRRALPATVTAFLGTGGRAWQGFKEAGITIFGGTVTLLARHHGPQGRLARTWPTGSMVLWVAVLLALYLVLYYFR